MYNKKIGDRMERFVEWLEADYRRYVKSEIEAGRSVPDRKDYAKYLGVSPETMSRWSSRKNPPDRANLITVVVNSGSIVPAEIFGMQDTLGDPALMEILAAWKTMTSAEREMLSTRGRVQVYSQA